MVAELSNDPQINVQLHRHPQAMATVEVLQEFRGDVTNEFQKTAIMQEDHRAKIQNVADAQMKADQAGQEYQR